MTQLQTSDQHQTRYYINSRRQLTKGGPPAQRQAANKPRFKTEHVKKC